MTILAGSAAGLFAGVDEVINACLGVTNYRTKTAAKTLVTRSSPIDGGELAEVLFEVLRRNWLGVLPARASSQNFRWHVPKQVLADRNASLEVTLERAFIRACGAAGRVDWSNQVPTISGIAGSHSNKRRSIDLVHRAVDGSFEFVELKIGSNTPIHATIEVLVYGILWLLSRETRTELGYHSNSILDSASLQLSTLAPAKFYTGVTPPEFATCINRGIAALGRRFSVNMSFLMTAFPPDFRWPLCNGHVELFHWFDDRTPLDQCV